MLDPTTIQESLATALVETLETMAFICVLPVDGEPAAPEAAVLVRIGFTGPCSGGVELVASLAVGQSLAMNMLGLSSEEAADGDVARDALKELMNVLCGAMLRKMPGDGAGFEMQLPVVSSFDTNGQWLSFITTHGVVVLDAEGSTIAVRMSRGE